MIDLRDFGFEREEPETTSYADTMFNQYCNQTRALSTLFSDREAEEKKELRKFYFKSRYMVTSASKEIEEGDYDLCKRIITIEKELKKDKKVFIVKRLFCMKKTEEAYWDDFEFNTLNGAIGMFNSEVNFVKILADKHLLWDGKKHCWTYHVSNGKIHLKKRI